VIKKITIEVIPHLDQRYNTVGDWQFERDSEGTATALNVRVSDLDNQEYFILIGLHEAIEALLCEMKGVKEKEVDDFDLTWTPKQVHWNSDRETSEPGEDYQAPYYEQHQIASGIERLLAARMWVNWARYETIVDTLCEVSKEHFALKLAESYTVIEEISDNLNEAHHESEPSPSVTKVDPSHFDDDIPF
jgi:hypothetical protein